MTSTFRTIAGLGIVAMATGLGAGLPPPAAAAPAPNAVQASGTAMAAVVHSITGAPLPRMPVTVRVISPDGDGGTQIFFTNRSGVAIMEPLEPGSYEAYVEFNNHRSASAFFVITDDQTVTPSVTISFNPDID